MKIYTCVLKFILGAFLFTFSNTARAEVLPSQLVEQYSKSVFTLYALPYDKDGYQRRDYRASAFLVESTRYYGLFITNLHTVVDPLNGDLTPLLLRSTDPENKYYTDTASVIHFSFKNDLALVHSEGDFSMFKPIDVFKSNSAPSMNESLSFFGFPLTESLTHFVGRPFLNYADDRGHIVRAGKFHHGTSGGPVFDSKGNFVGVSEAKYGANFLQCLGRNGMGVVVTAEKVQKLINEVETGASFNIELKPMLDAFKNEIKKTKTTSLSLNP